VAGSTETYTVYGLAGGTTYYFALKTADEAGNLSALSNSPGVFVHYVIESTITINGNPELSFVSVIEPSLAYVSTVSLVGTVVLATATEQGLTLASNLYEIGPEGTYEPSASLTFYYSTTTLADLGLLEEDIAIYEYSESSGWVKLANQTFDFESNRITAAITQISSIFGILGKVKDRAPPITTADISGEKGDNDWYVSVTTITLISTDTLSGVKQTWYSMEQIGFGEEILISSKAYTEPIQISSEGIFNVYYWSEDKVGNIEEEKSVSIKIDLTEPEITAISTPIANANGWNNTSVEIAFIGTDTVSGIKQIGYRVEGIGQSVEEELYTDVIQISSESANIIVTGIAYDWAGWCSTATVILNIDMTAPAISISSPAGGETFIATSSTMTINYEVADNLDPAPRAEAKLIQIEDLGSPRGERPLEILVSSGQIIEPLEIDDGIWELMVSATDFADNVSTKTGGSFEVIHDIKPPRTEIRVEGVGYRVEGMEYVTAKTSFTLTSIDDLIEANDGIGLGVKEQTIVISEGGEKIREKIFKNEEPKQGEEFVSTFTLLSIYDFSDGLYDLNYRRHNRERRVGKNLKNSCG